MSIVATKKRTYNDLCGLSHALELVGERWAILILRELETHGIVHRRTLAPPAASKVYELTEWGQELEPTLRSLGRWAARSPHFPDSGHFSPSSLAMNLETMFLADEASGLDVTLGLRLGDEAFALGISGDGLTVVRGEAEAADAVITTDPMTLVGLLYYGEDLKAAEKAGAIQIDGDRAAVERLPDLFELPEPVELEPA